VEHVVTFKSRPSPVDEPVDDTLAGGEVGAPVQLEPVVDLLGVGAAVDVDDQRVPLALAEVGRKIKTDLGLVLPVVDRDVEVGDLGQGLAGEVPGQLGVVRAW